MRLMCSVLNVSTSGFYRWKRRKPSRSSLKKYVLAVKILSIHVQCKKTGYRSVYKSQRKQGLRVGKNTVRRSMRKEAIKPSYVRKHKKYKGIQPECLAAYIFYWQSGLTLTQGKLRGSNKTVLTKKIRSLRVKRSRRTARCASRC